MCTLVLQMDVQTSQAKFKACTCKRFYHVTFTDIPSKLFITNADDTKLHDKFAVQTNKSAEKH